jgi:4-hydroxybenzoate polyprenyltransferase
MRTLRALLKAMRPRQWSKNVFIFAGIFFDGRILDPQRLIKSVAAFAIFCLISSAVYLVNDLADINKDRQHPVKCNRPLASGELKPLVAQLAALLIALVALPCAFLLNNGLGWFALLYAVTMVLYSFVLKNLVIIDVMTIAAGFVIRVFAGAAVVAVTRFSPWLYLCTILLSLFIAINKRRHEIILLADDANTHRTSLQEYSREFLDIMTSLVTSTALAAYSFYTFSAPNLPADHSMMLTVPFVLYGIFRYLYLIHVKNLGGAPEDIVLGDKPLLIDLGLWGAISGLVIYWPVLKQLLFT